MLLATLSRVSDLAQENISCGLNSIIVIVSRMYFVIQPCYFLREPGKFDIPTGRNIKKKMSELS